MIQADIPPAASRAFSFQGPAVPALDLSVVIVSYNTRAVTLRAVASVLSTAAAMGLEVIVVDNASSDGSAAALRTAFPKITVIAAQHNGGYAWGNNLGIARARGRHVLILNPDTEIHAGTLAKAVAYMDSHPEVGLLGGRAVHATGAQQSTVFRSLRLSHLLWNAVLPNRLLRRNRHFGDQRYAGRGRDTIMDVEVVAGCFLLAPRRVIAEAGAMDDRFFMYSEESEWCWRIRRAGYAVRYHPEIAITHHGAVATGQSSPWKSVEITKGRILFLRFTRGPGAARTGTALMLAGDLLRGVWILPWMLTARGRTSAGAWRARTGFLLRALVWQPRGQRPPASVPTDSDPRAATG